MSKLSASNSTPQFIFRLSLLLPLAAAALACSLLRLEIEGCRQIQSNDQFSDSKLKGVLTTDRDCYRETEPVNIGFTVENISDESITLQNPDGSVISLVFIDFFGSESYVWDDTSGASESLQVIELAPGENYTVVWSIVPEGYVGRGVEASVIDDGSRLLNLTLGITGPR